MCVVCVCVGARLYLKLRRGTMVFGRVTGHPIGLHMSGGISIIWDAACSGHGTCVIAAHLSLHS